MNSRRKVRVGRRLGWLAASALAAACAVDSKREVALYREVIDRDSPAAVEPPAPGETLTLERALLLANQRNEQLALQGEDYVLALIDRQRAAAAFFPSATLQVGETDRHGERRFRHDNHLLADGRIEMNVFDGFRSIALSDKTEAAAEQRRALLLDAQSSLLLSVSQAYYVVLRFERQVDVLRRSLEYQGERLRDMEERRRLGIARALDLAQTQAEEASTRVAMAQAESNAKNGRAALAVLIGVEPVDAPLIDEFEVPASFPSIDELLRDARAERQDLLAAQSAVEAAQHGIELAVREYLPTASVDLKFFAEPTHVWTSLLSASMPLFSPGLIQADVRTAWSEYRKALLKQSLLERQDREGVLIAYENLTASQRKLVEIDAEVSVARQASELAQRSYELGGATNLDRLRGQDRLLNAELDRARVSFDVKLFYLDLLRAIGRFGTTVAGHPGPSSEQPPGSMRAVNSGE